MFNLFKKKTEIIEKPERVIVEEYTDTAPIAAFLKNETGLTFDKQESILKNKLSTFAKQRKIFNFTELLQKIERESEIKQELIDYLTTNETFFYREFKQIEELVSLVKQKNAPVSILCAPSATGEEAFSIAIALLEAGVSKEKFKITGIDINSDAINKSMIAIYKERNVRNLSLEIKERYFSLRENRYHLNESIKSLVSFKKYNLFENSFKALGKFDFIFSRNMLIYFDAETKLKAKQILESMRKESSQPIFFGHADLF